MERRDFMGTYLTCNAALWSHVAAPQSTVMLTANVGFLAIPGVVLSNLSGTSLTSASQVDVFTSASQITSSLSVEASIGSIVIGLLLARHNRTRHEEGPRSAVSRQPSLAFGVVTSGQSTYLYLNSHPVFGLEPMAIIFSLPWALLMWSYVLSCFFRRCIRLAFMNSLGG